MTAQDLPDGVELLLDAVDGRRGIVKRNLHRRLELVDEQLQYIQP